MTLQQQRFDFDTQAVRNNAGTGAGIAGCVLAVIGIFTLGVPFVPLAGLCSIFGLGRAAWAGNGRGIGFSLLGLALTLFGVIVSPTVWALAVGLGLGALLITIISVVHVQPPIVPAPAPVQTHQVIQHTGFDIDVPDVLVRITKLDGDLQATNRRIASTRGLYDQAANRFDQISTSLLAQTGRRPNSQIVWDLRSLDHDARGRLDDLDNAVQRSRGSWQTRMAQVSEELGAIAGTCERPTPQAACTRVMPARAVILKDWSTVVEGLDALDQEHTRAAEREKASFRQALARFGENDWSE